MKGALAATVLALGASASVATAAHRTFVPTVRCDEIAGHVAQPSPADGGRVVLGTVSAPRRLLGTAVRVPGAAPFHYWLKAGLLVRAGRVDVRVSVPDAWRDRVEVVWGAPGTPARAVRFAPCPSTIPTWDGYAGGFLLRTRSACVPLVFTVGRRQARLRFDVGGGC